MYIMTQITENVFKYTAIARTVICGIYVANNTTISATKSTSRTVIYILLYITNNLTY